MLQAENIIVGSLGKVGSLYILNMKLIEVETGETLHSGSRQYKSIDDLVNNSRELTLAFLNREELPSAEYTESTPKDETKSSAINSDNNVENTTADEIIAKKEMEKQKQTRLEELNQKIDPESFAAWISENDFEGLATGTLDDRLSLAERFYEQTRTKWTVDLGLQTRVLDFGGYGGDIFSDAFKSIQASADFCYHSEPDFGYGFGIASGYFYNFWSYASYIFEYEAIIPIELTLYMLWGDKNNFAFSFGVFGNPALALYRATTDNSVGNYDFSIYQWYVGPSIGFHLYNFFLKFKTAFVGNSGAISDSNYGSPAVLLCTGYSLKLE